MAERGPCAVSAEACGLVVSAAASLQGISALKPSSGSGPNGRRCHRRALGELAQQSGVVIKRTLVELDDEIFSRAGI